MRPSFLDLFSLYSSLCAVHIPLLAASVAIRAAWAVSPLQLCLRWAEHGNKNSIRLKALQPKSLQWPGNLRRLRLSLNCAAAAQTPYVPLWRFEAALCPGPVKAGVPTIPEQEQSPDDALAEPAVAEQAPEAAPEQVAEIAVVQMQTG